MITAIDTPTPTTLPPGLHRDISFEDYLALDGINASTLKMFGQTPLHAKYKLDHPKDETAALLNGHASHTAILEPDKFEQLYACYPKTEYKEKYGHPSSNKYKAAKMAWYAEHDGACILDDDQWHNALDIAKAVHRHPVARQLLYDGRGLNELTGISTVESKHGEHQTKFRLDRLTEFRGRPCIVDLKNCAPKGGVLNDRVVSGAIARYGYHQQFAWYLDGLATLKPADRDVWLVFVEPEPPHDVVCYQLGEESIDLGRALNTKALNQLAEGRATGHWPGFSDQPQHVQCPDWAFTEESQ